MQGSILYRGALYKKVGLLRKRWRPSQFSREFVVPPHLKADWNFDAKNFMNSTMKLEVARKLYPERIPDEQLSQHLQPEAIMWHPNSGELLFSPSWLYHADLYREYRGRHPFDEYVRANAYDRAARKIDVYSWSPDPDTFYMYGEEQTTLCREGQLAFMQLMEQYAPGWIVRPDNC